MEQLSASVRQVYRLHSFDFAATFTPKTDFRQTVVWTNGREPDSDEAMEGEWSRGVSLCSPGGIRR